MTDLFETSTAPQKTEYSAQDIEVLEGLEPVRHRPGMYIGGTDIQAMHHLVAEILDNSMDEAVAGFANHIDVTMNADGSVTIADNGRGIPVDAHPKYPNLSALEVILTTLHSGGKFSNSVYKVSGGLHGVGLSVVNALSEKLVVEVAREKKLYRQEYAKGKPLTALELVGNCPNRRGTSITFKPDAEIFEGNNTFIPNRIYRMARSKAFLFKGIKINWACAPELIAEGDSTPLSAELNFPNGLTDFLNMQIGERATISRTAFVGESELANNEGRVEWAITWPLDENGFCYSYCNTVITPEGGTHETGFKSALLRGLKEYGEMANIKKVSAVTAEDFISDACIMLSVFITDPQFQGQTKDKLTSTKAIKLVETAVKDSFDHWLSSDVENWESINWKKYNRVKIFSKNKLPQLDNIRQGEYIGDCYFLSALGSLCEKGDYLKNMIEEIKLDNKLILYKVRLNINGKWKYVLLDNFFPNVSKNGKEMFCFGSSFKRELWVSLFEKAWAKINGCYARIGTGGYCREAYDILTEGYTEFLLMW